MEQDKNDMGTSSNREVGGCAAGTEPKETGWGRSRSYRNRMKQNGMEHGARNAGESGQARRWVLGVGDTGGVARKTCRFRAAGGAAGRIHSQRRREQYRRDTKNKMN